MSAYEGHIDSSVKIGGFYLVKELNMVMQHVCSFYSEETDWITVFTRPAYSCYETQIKLDCLYIPDNDEQWQNLFNEFKSYKNELYTVHSYRFKRFEEKTIELDFNYDYSNGEELGLIKSLVRFDYYTTLAQSPNREKKCLGLLKMSRLILSQAALQKNLIVTQALASSVLINMRKANPFE